MSPPRKCRVSSPLFKRMFQSFADYWGCHLICKIIPELEERCPNYNLKTHPASPKMFKSSLSHPKDAARIIKATSIRNWKQDTSMQSFKTIPHSNPKSWLYHKSLRFFSFKAIQTNKPTGLYPSPSFRIPRVRESW